MVNKACTNRKPLVVALTEGCGYAGILTKLRPYDLRCGAARDLANLPKALFGGSTASIAGALGYIISTENRGTTGTYIDSIAADTLTLRVVSPFDDIQSTIKFTEPIYTRPEKRVRLPPPQTADPNTDQDTNAVRPSANIPPTTTQPVLLAETPDDINEEVGTAVSDFIAGRDSSVLSGINAGALDEVVLDYITTPPKSETPFIKTDVGFLKSISQINFTINQQTSGRWNTLIFTP